MLIDIVVYDGLDEMDALGPLEVLRSASKQADVSVRLVTRVPQDVVTGACGLSFLPDAVYEPGEAEVLLVPGGGWAARADRSAWDDLEATGATLVTDRVVDDGDLVTSGGVTSGIDLALWLVERELSPKLAEQIATRMEYARQRPS